MPKVIKENNTAAILGQLVMLNCCVIRRAASNLLSASSNVDHFLQMQMRKVSSVSQPSVIRIPVKMAEKIREVKHKKKSMEREKVLKHSQKGKKSVPIISCKRKEYNHYAGQTYSKFQEVSLASKGWSHKKSVGDYFTINSYGKNPAFTHHDKDTLPEFDSLALSKDLLTQISKLGFQVPTNIQALAIPHVLEGKNTLITAETGNGKTLAFVAPMLQQIAQYKNVYGNNLPFNSPLGIIIVPGRELAEQIHAVASSLGNELGINVELVKGGRTKSLMLRPNMSQVHLLVSTIGALSKLASSGVYNTSLVRYIAIDEADSLLDDSFSERLLHFMARFPMQGAETEGSTTPIAMSGVQLTLVSATMPRSLDKILGPVVNLESVERISTPHLHRIMPHIPQRFYRVNNRIKAEKLLELVNDDKTKGIPVIIFSNYNKTSDWLSLFLNENNIPCVNLNGDMPAVVREGRFERFQSGKVIALSCTDLASRGLDTISVGHIINFEFPKFISDYIHRCGRTGRVGSSKTGLITNLVHRPEEIEVVQKIEYAARKAEEFHNVNANIKRALVGQINNQADVAG